MKFQIKNMVCDRCKMAVKNELLLLGITPIAVKLGEVEIARDLNENELKRFDSRLQLLGFQRIEDINLKIIEKIKTVIIELIHYNNSDLLINYSTYIGLKLDREYAYLSNLFSEHEGVTIEKFIIKQKIERVKELLVYNEFSLSDITFKMGYSSVAYLSYQFKKITGLTISQFRIKTTKERQALDQI